MQAAEDYAERATALQNDDSQWADCAWTPGPPPAPPQGLPQPPPPLLITGSNVKVHFFGVGANDAYLNPVQGIGIKPGPTGKAHYAFSEIVSLKTVPMPSMTLGSFADFILESQVGMSAGDLCSQSLKVYKLQADTIDYLAPFEMVGLDMPVALEYVAGAEPNTKLIIYLRAEPLRVSRAAAMKIQWESFKEHVAEEGFALSDAKYADLVGHGAGTIKKAISSNSPQDGKVRF